MIERPFALALVLIFSASMGLTACDRIVGASEQELIQRAKDFEDKGNLKSSIIELKNALQKNPNSVEARQLLGKIYLKSHQGAEAEKELSRAQQLGANREIIQPQLGEALLLMGEFQRVLNEIQVGDQTSPTNRARILQLRGHALLKLGKLKEGCDLFSESRKTDPGIPQTYWGLAQCSAAARDMKQARLWLDQAAKLPSEQARTRIFIGDWEQLTGNTELALVAYGAALKIEPDNLEALQNRATLRMARGQMDDAWKDIEHFKKIAPKSGRASYLTALHHFDQKKYREAQEALQETLKANPDYMPSVLLGGVISQALGAHEQAETYLNRFLARFPTSAYARRTLALTQVKQNLPDKALETLAPLLTSQTDSQAQALASEAYRLKNDSANAMTALENATRIDPKNLALQTRLGFNRLVSGDTSRAIAELQAASALNSGQRETQRFLALAYLEHRDYDRALSTLAASEKLLPLQADMLVMRAEAYLGKNDLAKTRVSYEHALAIDPVYFPAAAGLARLDIRAQDQAAARNRFIAILERDPRHLQALMALAEFAEMQNQEKMQREWLEKAIKAQPNAMAPSIRLVRYYLARKDAKKALLVASEAATTNPENPGALNLLGSTQLAVKDAAGATATFAKLTQKGSPSADAYLNLALAQLADNKSSVARDTLQKTIQLEPGHLRGLDTLVRLDLIEKKPDAALLVARQMQSKHPESALGYDREGDIQMAQKQPAQAVKAYERAMALGAGPSDLIKLHRALTLSGPLTIADARLLDGIKHHPDDLQLRAYAAEYFMLKGLNPEAIAHYEYLLKRLPSNVLFHNNLATLYQREKDYTRALVAAEQAYKLAPKNPAVQDTLGWILVLRGNSERGQSLLRQAAMGAPNSASIQYHFAQALTNTADIAQAKKILLSILRKSPGFPEEKEAKALLERL